MKSICENGKEKIIYIQVYQRVIYIQVLLTWFVWQNFIAYTHFVLTNRVQSYHQKNHAI